MVKHWRVKLVVREFKNSLLPGVYNTASESKVSRQQIDVNVQKHLHSKRLY